MITNLKKAKNLFYQRMKPALGQKARLSDSSRNNYKDTRVSITAENLSKEEMGYFLTLCHFIRNFQTEDKKEQKAFNIFKSEFYDSAKHFFSLKLSTTICSIDSFYKHEISRSPDSSKDLSYILSLPEDKLPIEQLFKIIPLRTKLIIEPARSIRTYKVICYLDDLISKMNVNKQLDLFNYLTKEDNRKNNLCDQIEEKEMFNFEYPHIILGLSEYMKFLEENNKVKELVNLKKYIKKSYFNRFNYILTHSHIESWNNNYDIYQCNTLKSLLAKIFIEDYIKKDKLEDFLSKKSTDILKYDVQDAENHPFVMKYNNLITLIDFCDCDIQSVKTQLQKTFDDCWKEKDNNILETNSLFSDIDYQPR